MYLPYCKRKVVFCNQKVEKLANSMGFVVGSKVSPEAIREVYEGIPTTADLGGGREFISEVKSYIPRYDPEKIESNEEKNHHLIQELRRF
jgi:hypothetical protein